MKQFNIPFRLNLNYDIIITFLVGIGANYPIPWPTKKKICPIANKLAKVVLKSRQIWSHLSIALCEHFALKGPYNRALKDGGLRIFILTEQHSNGNKLKYFFFIKVIQWNIFRFRFFDFIGGVSTTSRRPWVVIILKYLGKN